MSAQFTIKTNSQRKVSTENDIYIIDNMSEPLIYYTQYLELKNSGTLYNLETTRLYIVSCEFISFKVQVFIVVSFIFS